MKKTLFCILISVIPLQTHSLDLTIDLPLTEGLAKQNVAVMDKIQKNFVDKKKFSDKKKFIKIKSQPPLNQNIFSENNTFFTPTCLKSNVDFWKKIYSSVDSNEAFLHDRDDLSIIYKKINLPIDKRMKALAIQESKQQIILMLSQISYKLSSHKKLNSEEYHLLSLFPYEKQNSHDLMVASRNIRSQDGLKSHFQIGIQRSLSYLKKLLPIIEKEGLPKEIIYLPHVESSYNPEAGSKVGAKGLWQLMPSTMKLLAGRGSVSKRNDPKISTTAAAKLLKLNYEKTKSWPLAITAYNYGLSGVERAMKKTNSHDLCKIISRYNSSSFQFASSNFYAQFLAASALAKEKYLGMKYKVDDDSMVKLLGYIGK